MKSSHRGGRTLSLASLGAALATAAFAIVPPQDGPGVRYAFQAPELNVRQVYDSVTRLGDGASVAAALRLGSPAAASFVDLRTGRWASLQPVTPLLPGKGVGNALTWEQLGLAEPRGERALAEAAWNAFARWLEVHARDLGVNPAEIVSPGRVTVIAPEYIQIVAPRRAAGLPVQGAQVSATIRYGNLVIVGFENWGDLDELGLADLSADQAAAVLGRMVDRQPLGKAWKNPELAWIPFAEGETVTAADRGRGLGYRLAWVLRYDLATGSGRYEALVDAHDGTYLSFRDTAEYAASPRKVVGGVYPVSNDGVPPDGTEQAGWPMPFETITTPGGTMTTDAGGNLASCVDGTITSDLRGQYMYMNDTCGAASLSGTGNLDFGVSAGTDCTTPGVGGAGNTHSSRSGYFELNQMKAMARGQLPGNEWLQGQLTANMNLNQTCNAFWDGINVNFFKSGGGCRNTGEIAAVFDHEWGHGLDDNDASPGSNPGETTADVYASLRLDTSCIGRGFTSSNCSGYGNACLACTGVRDIDWDQRALHAPTTVTWTDVNCGSGGGGPCGGEVHCEGYIAGETIWDLWNRDLVAAPYNYSLDRAREVATQLSFRGIGSVTNWFACTQGSGGCGATSGYKQYLTADDDNGNLNDGTPHMAAIFAAFNRHGIACSTPTVQDSGCSGIPTSAPAVTATARDRGARLTWSPVSGASEYRVLRTDGVFGCDFGKTLIATTTATEFDDAGLQNGREYSYIVQPMGASDVCLGVPSSCTQVTPAAGASLVPQVEQATFPQVSGDGDPFIDNCETIRLQLPLANTGTGTLTNIEILSASSPSHPSTVFVSPFPVTVTASLASCATVNAQLDFVPQGLAQGDVFELDLVLSATEFGGDNRVAHVSYDGTESDLDQQASHTFDFEANTEGWTTLHGTFVRDTAGGGAGGSVGYMKSSAFLDQQCDIVRSPRFVPSATSTLQVYTNFNIEPFSDAWYDRANIGLVDRFGGRTLITPSTGRAYNANGPNGTCGTTGQPGWAGAAATWATSDWNATAFQSAANAGKLMSLQVNYGTDPAANNFGFHFDRATITDAGWEVPDTQGNVCSDTMPFLDGFETGDTSRWSIAVP